MINPGKNPALAGELQITSVDPGHHLIQKPTIDKLINSCLLECRLPLHLLVVISHRGQVTTSFHEELLHKPSDTPDVVHPDGGTRYPSFRAWLEQQVEKERSRIPDADEARALLREPDTPIGLRLPAVRDLLGIDDDLDWLTANAETGLTPDVGTGHQRWALGLLQWIDSVDRGHRFARWVRRIIDDTDFAEVSVVEEAVASADPETPTVAEILARERPADTARIGSLPTSDLADRYRVAPDPTIASHLTRRGHPLLCSPAEVELHQNLVARYRGVGFLNRIGTTDPDTHRQVVETNLTAAEITQAAARTELMPTETALALIRAGYPDDAVEHLNDHRNEIDFTRRLETMAQIDYPASWQSLDDDAAPDAGLRSFSLLAAARTHSPLLADRAANYLQGGDSRDERRDRLIALLALEIQPTDQAADALLHAWQQRSDLAALRALARRRDRRITNDAALFLADPDEEIRQIGADVLRDLRDPATIPTITAALNDAQDDDLTAVLAHTLTMLQATGAAELMRTKAEATTNQTLTQLLRRWANQLEAIT